MFLLLVALAECLPPPDWHAPLAEVTDRAAALGRRHRQFVAHLTAATQRWEKGDHPGDRARAKIGRQALNLAEDRHILRSLEGQLAAAAAAKRDPASLRRAQDGASGLVRALAELSNVLGQDAGRARPLDPKLYDQLLDELAPAFRRWQQDGADGPARVEAARKAIEAARKDGTGDPLGPAARHLTEKELLALFGPAGTCRELLGDDLTHLRRTLSALRDEQALLRNALAQVEGRLFAEMSRPYPVLRPKPPIVLTRGQTVKVTQDINWALFPDDELEIKVTASDPSLRVPGALKLDFEKHQSTFEYEIKAGDKAGAFTITLTPAKGRPVVVQVVVK